MSPEVPSTRIAFQIPDTVDVSVNLSLGVAFDEPGDDNMESAFIDDNLSHEPQPRGTSFAGWPVSTFHMAMDGAFVEQEEMVSIVREYGEVNMEEAHDGPLVRWANRVVNMQ